MGRDDGLIVGKRGGGLDGVNAGFDDVREAHVMVLEEDLKFFLTGPVPPEKSNISFQAAFLM